MHFSKFKVSGLRSKWIIVISSGARGGPRPSTAASGIITMAMDMIAAAAAGVIIRLSMGISDPP